MKWQRQSCRDHPSINLFKDGIEKDKLTGKEILSQFFILYLCLIQNYVLERFIEIESSSMARYTVESSLIHLDNDQSRTERTKIYVPKVGASLKSSLRWIKVFERSLIFYAWLDQDKIPVSDCTSKNSSDKSPNMKSTEEYLQLVQSVMIDKDLRTMKIHQTKHYEFYIKRLGVPSLFNGSIGERHQKSIVKNPGRRTQRRVRSLVKQSTERYYENTLIDIVFKILYSNGTI